MIGAMCDEEVVLNLTHSRQVAASAPSLSSYVPLTGCLWDMIYHADWVSLSHADWIFLYGEDSGRIWNLLKEFYGSALATSIVASPLATVHGAALEEAFFLDNSNHTTAAPPQLYFRVCEDPEESYADRKSLRIAEEAADLRFLASLKKNLHRVGVDAAAWLIGERVVRKVLLGAFVLQQERIYNNYNGIRQTPRRTAHLIEAVVWGLGTTIVRVVQSDHHRVSWRRAVRHNNSFWRRPSVWQAARIRGRVRCGTGRAAGVPGAAAGTRSRTPCATGAPSCT